MMQQPIPTSIPTAHLNVTMGAIFVTWLPYLDMGLRIVVSLVGIYSGILYIRKLRSK